MSDRQSPIRLFIGDNDPIFRLGLNTALASFADLEVLFTGNLDAIGEQLGQQQPDILILEPLKSNGDFCLSLKQDYPQLKILILSSFLSRIELIRLKETGIEGYCPKGTNIDNLVSILQQIAQGEKVWPSVITGLVSPRKSRRKQWLNNLIEPGLHQIDENIILVNRKLQKPSLDWIDKLYWTGRRRELLVARSIVKGLLGEEVASLEVESVNTPEPIKSTLPVVPSLRLLEDNSSQSLTVATVLENTLNKIRVGGENRTKVVLEIDILQADKRRDLLYLVFSKFRQIISEFPTLETIPIQLKEKVPLLLQEIWAESLRLFLEIYYPDKNEINQGLADDLIFKEIRYINTDILQKIPFQYDIFAYFMYRNKLKIDKIEYEPDTPEAISRAEIILQNLIIKVACAVMAVILNNFFDREDVIEKMFNPDMKSSREIAKFRNDLSWQYRQNKYWEEPKAIFESQYKLFYLEAQKINQIIVNSPRQHELRQLKGLPFTVTILLESRDAIAPRFRAVIALVGQGLVYVLTQVIGRGIGLIGRGIIQGVGNTFQDVKYGKNSKQ